MEPGFIDLTAENIADQHLCCIIRSKKPHPGVEAKRRWLVDRLPEGHVFRKLDVKEKVFIEYAPLETAWVPVEGDNYLYLYCLWVAGAYKGKGYGRALMEHCLADARDRGKSGICMLGAEKQKAWLSDQSFARKYGFETVDETGYGYTLLARSFDGTLPRFTDQARAGTIEEKALTIITVTSVPMRSTAWRSSGRCVERPGLRILWCLWTHWRRPRPFPACSTTTPCFTAVPSRR